MAEKDLGCCVSDMVSAACSLEYLRDKMEEEHRYGEAYILDLIKKTISEGAEAFSTYEMKEQ